MPTARMVPVFLQPNGRLIVVFGGGPVALRKCQQFAGFRLRVVAAAILPELKALADEVREEHFDPTDLTGHLDGAFIAVAATDRHELNDAIVAAARQAGIPANSATGGGDILLPSVVRKKEYTVAVSSEGLVPAFPPYVAARLDEFLGPEYDAMLDLLAGLRAEIRTEIPTQPARAACLAAVLASDEVWSRLKAGDRTGALAAARRAGGLPSA